MAALAGLVLKQLCAQLAAPRAGAGPVLLQTACIGAHLRLLPAAGPLQWLRVRAMDLPSLLLLLLLLMMVVVVVMCSMGAGGA